ncbi:MAG: hypothetical protein M0Z50_04690 [Planctomycetia bacterium]|nr:hypothetical protein [Planctomycetia bacterium]
MSERYVFTERDRAELRRIIHKIDNIRGYGVINTPTDLAIAPPPPQPVVMAGAPGIFPVLVKQNGGAAGTANSAITATYDLYAVRDTNYTHKLNANGALAPLMNRALISPADVVIAPAIDGSIGIACYDGGGNAVLLWVPETPEWGC